MYDLTPAPFGDVTRRWTSLDKAERQRHAARLVACTRRDDIVAHVDRPGLDGGVCYQQLVPAAAAGDPIALAWLATTHRPLLIARGRALFDHDPSEWGAVCLEVLHVTLASADLSEVTWLRRRIARKLTHRLSREVVQHLERRRREYPIEDPRLHARQAPAAGCDWDPHPDLTMHLDRALHALDAPARESLLALANREPLARIAERHDLSYAAVRQRVTRARKRLQPELAVYRRVVGQ